MRSAAEVFSTCVYIYIYTYAETERDTGSVDNTKNNNIHNSNDIIIAATNNTSINQNTIDTHMGINDHCYQWLASGASFVQYFKALFSI